jgi:hypothetical protein
MYHNTHWINVDDSVLSGISQLQKESQCMRSIHEVSKVAKFIETKWNGDC